MKRTIRLTAKDKTEKLEVVLKLNGDYSGEWSPRDESSKRINKIVDKLVKEVLLEYYQFKDIKIKR